jgi:cobyrinic acid a,c-diamide synthase
MITRRTVAAKIADHLHHKITLPDLVDWAERQMMEGDFEESDLETIRNVLGRLGVADVRAFGLTWEDCESLLRDLGYSLKIEIAASP